MPMEDPMMGQPDMMGDQGMDGGFDTQMNPEMGGDPNAFEGGNQEEFNQFDTNFDAGVEADEETDPKRYIQQLTGKLSQSLNKYNDEQGEDEGLSKYVGKMILAQAAKALDEKGKKELIKAINTTETEEDESLGEEPEMDTEVEGGDEEIFNDTEMEQPIQECRFTKRELIKLKESVNNELFDEENLGIQPNKTKLNKNNPFTGKKFNK
jgi:hypothetical protein